MKIQGIALSCCIAASVCAEQPPGAAPEWPLKIEGARAPIVMYQPQPYSFKDNKLTARSAVSIQLSKKELIFGAAWIEARLDIDRGTRTAAVKEIQVTRTRFTGATAEKEQTLSKLLTDVLSQKNFVISLDRLLVSLENAEKEQQKSAELRNNPPRIYFEKSPAVLVIFDGEPQLRKDTSSAGLPMRAVNTPFEVTFDPATKIWRLHAGDRWLSAPDLNGPWKDDSHPPAAVPKIILSKEPAELIVSKGEPVYTPFPGDQLLYMANTESNVFMESATSKVFVLLSGRWFSAPKLEGPWSFVPPDKLPAVFATIPPNSLKANVLASVAGTEAAKEAVLDAQIPQTTAVKRKEKDSQLKVKWDGEPVFVNIEGLGVAYSRNASVPVFRVGDKGYWACDQGVWYISEKTKGPWKVADSVPKEIYDIPPSCPYYNCRYVVVYQSTPDVVYVGYYPGYVGSYPYYGVVYYGTGYPYSGWYGTEYYYGPTVTFGFGFSYYPYYGWGYPVYPVYPVNPGGGWWGPGGRPHVDHHGGARGDRVQNRPSQPTANNVYADRDGNISRRNDNGRWQDRSGSEWKDNPSPRQDIQRDSSARDRGAQRASHYQHTGAGRGYGGGMGGGMRGGGMRGGGRR